MHGLRKQGAGFGIHAVLIKMWSRNSKKDGSDDDIAGEAVHSLKLLQCRVISEAVQGTANQVLAAVAIQRVGIRKFLVRRGLESFVWTVVALGVWLL